MAFKRKCFKTCYDLKAEITEFLKLQKRHIGIISSKFISGFINFIIFMLFLKYSTL